MVKIRLGRRCFSTEAEVREFYAGRERAGRQIDPVAAEVRSWWSQMLDPSGLGLDIPEGAVCRWAQGGRCPQVPRRVPPFRLLAVHVSVRVWVRCGNWPESRANAHAPAEGICRSGFLGYNPVRYFRSINGTFDPVSRSSRWLTSVPARVR